MRKGCDDMSTFNQGVSNHNYRNIKDEFKRKKAKRNKIDLYRITILSWLIFAIAILLIYFVLMG